MLIDTAYFRDFNSVDDNVDSSDIDKKIFRAERKLEFLLGPAFYLQIVTEFESQTDTSGLSADNLALYSPYVKEFLAAEGYVQLLAKGQFSVTRSGIVTFQNDNNQPSANDIVGQAIRDAKNEAEQFKNGMISFLDGAKQRDATKYPLYSCGNSKLGTQFQITAVKRFPHKYRDTDKQTLYGD